jgi:TonB-linked SusC/RagA family outer membrane protein
MIPTVGQRMPRRFGLAACLVVALSLLGSVPRAGALASPVANRLVGSIAGRVTDQRTNVPLPGTTVQVQGTSLSTTTDADGRYRIAGVSAGAHVVLARRIGYTAERQSVTVSDDQQATADFHLNASPFSLEEIVITGTAGGEQRRTLGNSVAIIDASTELQRSAAPSLTALLNARAPGAIITPGSGRIGAGPTIQIRGRSTLSLGNDPIVYIDGVRVNAASGQGINAAGASSFGSQGSTSLTSRLDDINPDDIESIEVIRGPAAATIYGTEAANGVIQIITKKGRSGVTRWSFTTEQGRTSFQNAASRIPTNYFKNAQGVVVPWNGYQQEADSGRQFFRNGRTQSYNINVSGGRDALTYYVSGSYDDQEGIEPNNSGKSFSGRANLNAALSPRLDLQTNLGYVRSSTHLGADNGVSPLFTSFFGHILTNPTTRGFYLVPPEIPQRLYDNSVEINRFTGGATLNHRPISWFNQRLVLGLDFTSDDSRALERFATPDLAPFLAPLGGANISGGRIGQTLRNNTFVTGDYSGTARFKLSSNIASNSSVGANFVRKQLKLSFLSGLNFPAPGLETVSSTTLPQVPQQQLVVNTTLGVWGQQQFGYKDRLFLTGALRVDNNSAFGEEFKWVAYPKLSAAWVMSEEAFFSGLRSSLNTLKLRGAYGQSGTQPDAFAALRTFVAAGRANGESGVTPGSVGNDSLKPERARELEVGFEAELFNRLSLDFSYFHKRTTDAIIQQSSPPSSGFPGNQPVNIGATSNRGIELQAIFQALSGQRVAWEIGGNIATNKDRVEDTGLIPFLGSTNVRSTKGYPINAYWSRRVVSADRDPTTNAITNVLCDGGATGVPVACSAAPEVFIATQTPKLTGAFTTTVTLWKRLALYGMVDFKRGHRLYNGNEQLRCGTLAEYCDAFYNKQNYETLFLAAITPASRSANIIAPFLQNASFFRLSELSVSYQLPAQWLRRAGITSARLGVAGRNLHTWTKYRGLDPEGRLGVTDQAITPPLQRLLISVNFTF